MWQAPDGKRRAMAEVQREARERSKRQSRIRVCRTAAQVRIGGAADGPLVVPARVVLNEVTPKGMQLFVGQSLPVGALAQIALEEPRRVYVRATIVSSQEFSSETRIIRTEPFSYRVGVAFAFETEEDEKSFKSFLEDLKAQILGAK